MLAEQVLHLAHRLIQRAGKGVQAVGVVGDLLPDDLQAQVATGQRPRADYLELARGFGADLLDYRTAAREGGVVAGADPG